MHAHLSSVAADVKAVFALEPFPLQQSQPCVLFKHTTITVTIVLVIVAIGIPGILGVELGRLGSIRGRESLMKFVMVFEWKN